MLINLDWVDAVYRAVEAVNTAQGNKYHAVGGAAGTVSPSEYIYVYINASHHFGSLFTTFGDGVMKY